MRTIVFLFFVLTMVSCKYSQVDEIVVENNVSSPEVYNTNIDEMLYVDKIGAWDSLLVFINRKDETIFYVYNTDFIYKGSFGTLGHGPNEFQFPFYLNSNKNIGQFLPIYDVNLASFKHIDISSTLEEGKVIVSSMQMPKQLIGSPNLNVIDDFYYGNIDSGQGLFFIFDAKTEDFTWIDFPKSLQSPKGDFTVMNMNRITVNPHQEKIVSAMGYYNLLFLYDMNGNLIKTIQLGEKLISPTIIGDYYISGENLICSRDIESTDTNVYVLMQNVKERDFEKINNAPSRIICFDWNLNYNKTYQLPHYSLDFYVDERNDRIIYTALNGEGGTDIYYLPM